MIQVDARGLSCPEPVMLTMKQIEKNENEIEVLLNSTCSIENVTKFAKSKKYNVEQKKSDDYTSLILTKQ